MRSNDKALKVSFFGHFGSTNSGNESTLLAILERIRALRPATELRCICTNPDVVATRYGIDAIPITTRVARVWDRNVPLTRRVPMAFLGLAAEPLQFVRAFRTLKGTDMLIVPGTGLVTDAWGVAKDWGPYNMFKWVLMAKARRSKVLLVSIGAGPIDGVLGRILVKAIMSLADYRSYRDDSSRDCLRGIGFHAERDRVYPDLVFGLPDEMLSPGRTRSDATRRVVGLGLMVYSGTYSTADPNGETFTTYLESLAVFATWLLDHDYDIRLLLGDDDRFVIDQFRSLLGDYDEARIVEQPIESVQDVLAELAATDVVVATRFHNVLLALLHNKPVVAISFHHKCSSLMRRMQLSDYCHDISRMDADTLIHQFETLERNQESVKGVIGRGVSDARAALDEQYDLLFATP